MADNNAPFGPVLKHGLRSLAYMRVRGRQPPVRNESDKEGSVARVAVHLLPVWIPRMIDLSESM